MDSVAVLIAGRRGAARGDYAQRACSTHACASSVLPNQSLYISFRLVLVYVLSGHSSASLVAVIAAITLP